MKLEQLGHELHYWVLTSKVVALPTMPKPCTQIGCASPVKQITIKQILHLSNAFQPNRKYRHFDYQMLLITKDIRSQ